MTWVTLDKSFKYSQDFSAFFQIFQSSQMLPKQLKDSQRHQRQLKQIKLFLQSNMVLMGQGEGFELIFPVPYWR